MAISALHGYNNPLARRHFAIMGSFRHHGVISPSWGNQLPIAIHEVIPHP